MYNWLTGTMRSQCRLVCDGHQGVVKEQRTVIEGTNMAIEGSYDWWRANYASDARYIAVCQVLQNRDVDCSETEVDHFPPNKSYEGTTFANITYGQRPAFPVPKYLHRFHKGGGGMGGHVSTTGSTFVSNGWTPMLSKKMALGNFFGAMNADLIDKQNVAFCASGNRNLFDPILQPAVYLAHSGGLIKAEEYLHICWNFFRGLGSL